MTDGWHDTPDGQGLLPAAIAEARIAAQHAALAAKDPANLDAMKLHSAHVLHAVDPEQIENGPGLGYGVKKAAAGAAQHIMAASNAEGASDAVKAHANHVATSAQNTVSRADLGHSETSSSENPVLRLDLWAHELSKALLRKKSRRKNVALRHYLNTA